MFNIKNMFYNENDVKLGLISFPSKSLEEKREIKGNKEEQGLLHTPN